jgi:hypothetical protein
LFYNDFKQPGIQSLAWAIFIITIKLAKGVIGKDPVPWCMFLNSVKYLRSANTCVFILMINVLNKRSLCQFQFQLQLFIWHHPRSLVNWWDICCIKVCCVIMCIEFTASNICYKDLITIMLFCKYWFICLNWLVPKSKRNTTN